MATAKGLGLTTATGYILVDTTLKCGITNTYTSGCSTESPPQPHMCVWSRPANPQLQLCNFLCYSTSPSSAVPAAPQSALGAANTTSSSTCTTSKTFCGFPGLKAIIGILWFPTNYYCGKHCGYASCKACLAQTDWHCNSCRKTIHYTL